MNKKNLILILFFFFPFLYAQEEFTIDYYKEDSTVNLFAFIGKKIAMEEFDPNARKANKIEIDPETGDTIIRIPFVMDRTFKLKYKVIKNLYNNLKVDTIEFVAYDHYGEPDFAEYKNVILYISKSTDSSYYFHQKYQYNEIHKTKSNEWIGLLNFGSAYRIKEGRKLNLKKIKLNESANTDLKHFSKLDIKFFFPKPFYKIKNNKAIPILGISIKDLIHYKVKSITTQNKY
jgi:hypothetical protein